MTGGKTVDLATRGGATGTGATAAGRLGWRSASLARERIGRGGPAAAGGATGSEALPLATAGEPGVLAPAPAGGGAAGRGLDCAGGGTGRAGESAVVAPGAPPGSWSLFLLIPPTIAAAMAAAASEPTNDGKRVRTRGVGLVPPAAVGWPSLGAVAPGADDV